MTPDAAFAHPRDMSRFDLQGKRKRVVVVGGGIAGLTATYELANQGHEVILLEATDRLGGRILTERFGNPDGPYAELGAMRIPHGHRCVDYYVKRFRLKRRHFVSSNDAGLLYLRDQRLQRKDWKKAAALFGATRDYSAILVDIKQASGAPVNKWTAWEQIGRWAPLWLRSLESRSLGELANSAIDQGLVSTDEWDWVRQITGFAWIEDASILFWDNVGSLLDSAGRYELDGGMMRLVDAFITFMQDLTVRPQVGRLSPVHRIRALSESVLVEHGRFAPRQIECHYVILAVPAGRVPLVDFDPSLPPSQLEALRSVYYFPLAKSVALFDERFWESDEGICGGTSITDLANQQIWYPSDNAVPASQADVKSLQRRQTVLAKSTLGKAPKEPIDWKARDKSVASGPGALIAGYMWGVNAQRFAAMAPAARDRLILQCLARIHPRARDHIVGMVHRVWAEDPSPGGGGFAYFRPTEQRRYAQLLCQPHGAPGVEPRIFFAGEHDGVAQGWIQGAIQSALAATASVLQAPAPQ